MTIKYGRGKHKAHINYIEYMEMIVKHPIYSDMPNAIGEKGKINWQVSSGKTTSFYKYYLARTEWWVKKADSLGVPGKGNSDDRFTITARLIHPTGKRACRLCGVDRYVGYMYVNDRLAKNLNKNLEETEISKSTDIIRAIDLLLSEKEEFEVVDIIKSKFKERSDYFDLLPNFELFFTKTQHIRSNFLSPGFMGNPPDRLDGFHDYGICCRKDKDPGRFDENMRTYNHDRRAFQWWAEGDWIAADALYNKAGAGKCNKCGRKVGKISPDHIGPLSCGFKQMPFFEALCSECNSSKNRRFTYSDVKKLIEYEEMNSISVASWQVRALWDSIKNDIQSDEQAKVLSNYMRSLQDYYLRFLHQLKIKGFSQMLSYYLTPKNALNDVIFEDLDTSNLTYKSYVKESMYSNNRLSLVGRTVRIAFEELDNYSSNFRKVKKLNRIDPTDISKLIDALIKAYDFEELPMKSMEQWHLTINNIEDLIEKEEQINNLLYKKNYEEQGALFKELNLIIKDYFDRLGEQIVIQIKEEFI